MLRLLSLCTVKNVALLLASVHVSSKCLQLSDLHSASVETASVNRKI
jgi:hypothetical protein